MTRARDRTPLRTPRLMFATGTHEFLAPCGGRKSGTEAIPASPSSIPGWRTVAFDPRNRRDRQMNASVSVPAPNRLGANGTRPQTTSSSQLVAIYRPRLFIVEAGNSFGLFGESGAQAALDPYRRCIG